MHSPLSRLFVLIPAGGSGSRAGGHVPKQYQNVAGWPVLAHTLRAFVALPLQRIVVLTAPHDPHWDAFAQQHLGGGAGAVVAMAACAGATRAQTVSNGLDVLLREHGAALSDWVLVHDAARCLLQTQQVQALIDACASHAVGGLLAWPVADTLKRADGDGANVQVHVRETIERTDKWLAQTPQMFRLGVLRDALMRAGDGVSDESTAIEALGLSPLLIKGSAQNFKLTWPEDFEWADLLLRHRAQNRVEAAPLASLFVSSTATTPGDRA